MAGIQDRQQVVDILAASFDDNRSGCALVLLPDQKKTTLQSVLLDLKLIFTCVGLSNLTKTLVREVLIKKIHPGGLMYYLWFIGVDPGRQHRGTGSRLLREVVREGVARQRPVYLETSTPGNIPWYEKRGFSICHELDLGYRLFFMRKD